MKGTRYNRLDSFDETKSPNCSAFGSPIYSGVVFTAERNYSYSIIEAGWFHPSLGGTCSTSQGDYNGVSLIAGSLILTVLPELARVLTIGSSDLWDFLENADIWRGFHGDLGGH